MPRAVLAGKAGFYCDWTGEFILKKAGLPGPRFAEGQYEKCFRDWNCAVAYINACKNISQKGSRPLGFQKMGDKRANTLLERIKTICGCEVPPAPSIDVLKSQGLTQYKTQYSPITTGTISVDQLYKKPKTTAKRRHPTYICDVNGNPEGEMKGKALTAVVVSDRLRECSSQLNVDDQGIPWLQIVSPEGKPLCILQL